MRKETAEEEIQNFIETKKEKFTKSIKTNELS